jgi:hypothetical protein
MAATIRIARTPSWRMSIMRSAGLRRVFLMFLAATNSGTR